MAADGTADPSSTAHAIVTTRRKSCRAAAAGGGVWHLYSTFLAFQCQCPFHSWLDHTIELKDHQRNINFIGWCMWYHRLCWWIVIILCADRSDSSSYFININILISDFEPYRHLQSPGSEPRWRLPVFQVPRLVPNIQGHGALGFYNIVIIIQARRANVRNLCCNLTRKSWINSPSWLF